MKNIERRIFLTAIQRSERSMENPNILQFNVLQITKQFISLCNVSHEMIDNILDKWKSKGMINDIDEDSPICELVTTNFQGEYLALYIYHDTKGPRLKTQKDLYVEWLELTGCESCKVKSVPTWFKHELKLHFTYFISPIVNEIGYKNIYYIIDVDDYTDILKSIESNSTYEKMSVEDYKNDIRYKTNDCTEEITKDFEDSVRQKFIYL